MMNRAVGVEDIQVNQSLHSLLRSRGSLPWVLALLSVGAAAFHFAVAPEHFNEYALFGWFFVIVAWLQAVWAMSMVSAKPGRALLYLGVIGNLLLVALYFWTRLVQVPIGPEAGNPESFEWPGIVSVIFEAGVVVLGLVLLSRPGLSSRRALPTVAILSASVILLVVVGIVLGYGSGGEHEDAGHDEIPTTVPLHQHGS